MISWLVVHILCFYFIIFLRLQGKESEISKLSEELKSRKEEIEKMKEAIEQQKTKNNVSHKDIVLFSST